MFYGDSNVEKQRPGERAVPGELTKETRAELYQV